MPDPIADDPASWSWPEDVRERMAARRREIEAVREQAAEAQAAAMPRRKLTEQEAAEHLEWCAKVLTNAEKLTKLRGA